MVVPIHEVTTPLRVGDIVYSARVLGARRDTGMWEGWIEFVPSDGTATLSTDRETVQSSLSALRYWAGPAPRRRRPVDRGRDHHDGLGGRRGGVGDSVAAGGGWVLPRRGRARVLCDRVRLGHARHRLHLLRRRASLAAGVADVLS